ncbi:MAG: hypothetical protein ACXAC7_04230 [Candidatus Hodarchaeales archaeon]|jgi:hypothetical protein
MNLYLKFFPISKEFDTIPYNLFLNQKLHISTDKLHLFIIIVTLISGGGIFLVGGLFSLSFFYFFGLMIWLFLPRLCSSILIMKMNLEKHQFDLDALFALNEILTVSNTTRSETQSYFLLSKSNNIYLKYVAKKAIISKSTSNPIGGLAFIDSLKELWKCPSQQLLIQFYEYWKDGKQNQHLHQHVLINQIHTQLEKDFRNLDTSTSYINAFLGIIPIGLLFVILISTTIPRIFLEFGVLALIGTLFVLYFLDPYRIREMSNYVGDLDYSQHWVNGTIITDILVKSLQSCPDFNNSLRNVINHLQQHNLILEFTILDNKLACGEDIPIPEIIATLNPLIGDNVCKILIMTQDLCKIDVQTSIQQLMQFSKGLSLLENHYHRKKGILLGEKRKALLLLSLSAFSLGLLTIISPLFLQINQLNYFQNNTVNLSYYLDFSINLSLIIESWLIVLFSFGNYVTAFQLKNWRKFLIIVLFLTTLFVLGFSFAWGLTRPTILMK